MISSEKNSGRSIKTTSLRLNNGWSGRAVVFGACGRNFSRTDWTNCLSQPQLLFEDVEKILKTEGRNCVAVKNLTMGDSQLKVVIKRHYSGDGLRQFFRSFRPGKALRNFKTAVKLLRFGIPIAAPFAAIHQRRNLLTKQSVYITEYLENSPNLYTFASEQLPKIPAAQFALKKQLCYQLAVILASLHKNGLWHRDSKASNFIVCRDTQSKYRILLVDMDGIKRYFLRRKSCQFQSLWRLAASTLPLWAVNRTDYLRVFTAYCNLIGLEVPAFAGTSLHPHKRVQRHRIFRELASRAEARHLRSMRKACPERSRTGCRQ